LASPSLSLSLFPLPPPPPSTLFPYTTLFRSRPAGSHCPTPICRTFRFEQKSDRKSAVRSFRAAPGMSCCLPTIPRSSFASWPTRSEEHTSELQSLAYIVCRLLLGKKNTQQRL